MTLEEPKPGEWHEGYWYEWEWVSAKGVTPYNGFWQVEVPMRIFPWGDGYSISVADTGLPARPVTFREAEEIAVAADAEALALAAEVERLRAAVTAYRHVFTVMSAQGETDPWYEMALIDGTLEGDMQALRKASLLFPALDPSIAVQAALRGLERGDGE